MAEFFQKWLKKNFSKNFDVKCDEMVIGHQGLFDKLDNTSKLLKDHRKRGEETYHFYLCDFRPLWTDCTCEGYHAENFGMTFWQSPKDEEDYTSFLAEKNCTVVSHELAHELLRQSGHKRYVEVVHDVWTRHFYDNLPFRPFGKNFEQTNDKPYFLTIETSDFGL